MYPDDFLVKKLAERAAAGAMRQLRLPDGKIDFCSNDYLGIVNAKLVSTDKQEFAFGSTGSRLLAGNYALLEETEQMLATFHEADAALIYNSGYDANVGLLSCVPQRGDTVLYDYLSHASIRDGIRLSFATAHAFKHNDMADLAAKLKNATGNIFIVTESVFSMDGDICPLPEIIALAQTYKAHVIVDEAHATGVIGSRGEGLVQALQMQQDVFARVHTFGKAVGCHGAVVLGSKTLRQYLVNFSRSLMYSTALPPQAVEHIKKCYGVFPEMHKQREYLQQLITSFQQSALPFQKLVSDTAIQGVIIPGNEAAKKVAEHLQQKGFDVRPILYPTVPKGSERLRIVLHAFNTVDEVNQLITALQSAALLA